MSENPNEKAEIYYAIREKSNRSEAYNAAIKELIGDEADKLANDGVAVGSKIEYIGQKRSIMNDEISKLNQSDFDKIKADFDKRYPLGFSINPEEAKDDYARLTTPKIVEEKKVEQPIKQEEEKPSFSYIEYEKVMTDFLKTEQINDNARYEKVQAAQTILNQNPERFNEFTEKYFEDGVKTNTLPKLPNGIDKQQFAKHVQTKLLNETRKISNLKNQGEASIKSSEQLKAFRQKQFKEKHTEAKKLIQGREISQRQKVDNIGMKI